MISYENFLKIGLRLQKSQRRGLDLYQKYDVDLIAFEEVYHEIIQELLKEVFNKEQLDWWDWFCYETEFGQKDMQGRDEKGNPICYSWESLYEHLKSLENGEEPT